MTLSAIDHIAQFTHTYPDACDHVVDLPYRLCSPSAQDERNAYVWTDEAGSVTGFGLIQLQFSTLDWAVAPGHDDLSAEIFAWALTRLAAIRAEREQDIGFLFGSRTPNDPAVISAGFEDDQWAMRHLSMPLTEQLAQPKRLEGIRIRPLGGVEEVEAYVSLHRAAFDTRNMSVEWRARTLAHPAYQPALDFVAEDAEGKLVAFCIGWMSEVAGVKTGQIEPLGVLPALHGRGIGRAILLTVLQAMRQRGCIAARVDAESANPASNALYESVGFAEFARTHQHFRWF